MEVNNNRIQTLISGKEKDGPIIYWMSRDQRTKDNWALLYAAQLAQQKDEALIVVFVCVSHFLEATIRQYNFMLQGLREVETNLHQKNIPFYLLSGEPADNLIRFLHTFDASHIVTDFDPLNIKRKWKKALQAEIDIPMYEVDAHNIVPCFFVSDKPEYGAYTIRPKINKQLNDFLEPFPELPQQDNTPVSLPANNWEQIYQSLQVNNKVAPIDWIKPGETEAWKNFTFFLQNKLDNYYSTRNNPVHDSTSHLSPYLHFGQISAQQIVMQILKNRDETDNNVKAFLEQIIIRRELADNFCYYCTPYDSFESFPTWAKETLIEHWNDPREQIYTINEFEQARTHDPLWNAAQKALVYYGYMHGYMRMYWAKKILEWSNSPGEALEIALYLNDKYELDGRTANGYAGCAWAIGGVHDHPWKERPVYGKIRYMNYNGAKRKFNVDQYINNYKDIDLE